MGSSPSCFHSGHWFICDWSIHWVNYYSRKSEAGAESQESSCVMPRFAQPIVKYSPPLILISEAAQLTPFPRHLNAYLRRVLRVTGFSMAEWIDTYIFTIKRPFGNPCC